MKMGLSQADSVRRFNVSRSLVQQLGSIWIRNNILKKTCSRPPMGYNPCARSLYSSFDPKEEERHCDWAHFNYHIASGTTISTSTVRKSFHTQGLCARRPVVCVPLNRRHRTARVRWKRVHITCTKQQWPSVLFTDESRFTLQSVSDRVQ